MIDASFLPLVLMTVGLLMMMSCVFINKFRVAVIIIIVGTVMFLSGILLAQNPSLDFCEDNNGIYSNANSLSLCSVPDENGEYVVYKVIKVGDEFKLARFSELSRAESLQGDS